MTPRVSVVIPTYNYGHFVAEALESVLAQTFRPHEIVVVDDGSTDNTREVLAPYMGRVKYIHKKNGGLSAARNTGILAATGDWIALLDSDDTWLPQKLEKQVEFAVRHPEIGFIGTLETTPKSRPAVINTDATFINTRDFLGGPAFGVSSILVRRSMLLKAGLFDTTLRSVEDRDMYLKLSTLGPAARVNAGLWTYRRHANQMHSNAARMQQAYAQVLHGFFEAFPEFRQHKRLAYAYYHFDSAEEFNVGRESGRAIAHLLKSFAFHLTPLPQLCSTRRFNRVLLLAKCIVGEQRLSSLIGLLRPGRRHAEPTAAPH